MDNLRAIIFMCLAMAGFALEDFIIKIIAEETPVSQVLITIGCLGTVLFSIIALAVKAPIYSADILTFPVIFRNIADLFGALFFVTAIALTPLAIASSILQATPLVVTLGAAMFLKERVGWRRWTASLVGFAGVLLILRPGMAGFQPESLFAVLGVLCLSARDLATRVIRAQLSSVTVSIYAFVATTCAGVIALPFTGPFTPLQDVNWFLFACAVLIGCFAYFTLISATRIGDASVVSPFRYSRLIFALVLAMVFLGERPDTTTFIGAAIILTSGIYIFWRERVLDRKTF